MLGQRAPASWPKRLGCLGLFAALCVSGEGEQCYLLQPHSHSASSQVYVLKRPYVDEFLRRMGELFECVLFTASLAKVPTGGMGGKNRSKCGGHSWFSSYLLVLRMPQGDQNYIQTKAASPSSMLIL